MALRVSRYGVLAFLILSFPACGFGDCGSWYGFCTHSERPLEASRRAVDLPLIRAANAGSVRFGLKLADVCDVAHPGSWDFSVYDRLFDDLQREGLLAFPILHAGVDARKFNPQERSELWREFVRRAAGRYRGKVVGWEVWNEPNAAMPVVWKAEDYVALVKQTREEIRKSDPSVMVVGGALAGIGIDYAKQMYQAGFAGACDALSVHPYCPPWKPEGRLDVWLEALRNLMKANGEGEKPIWISEIGAGRSKGDPAKGEPPLTVREQGLCVARSLAIAFAEGVDRLFWYSFRSENYRLVNFETATPEDGYVAFKTFSKLCPSGSKALSDPWHDAARRVYHPGWMRPDGVQVHAIWATEAVRLKIWCEQKAATFDYLGRKVVLPDGVADGGKWVEVTVDGSPIYIVGTKIRVETASPLEPVGDTPSLMPVNKGR